MNATMQNACRRNFTIQNLSEISECPGNYTHSSRMPRLDLETLSKEETISLFTLLVLVNIFVMAGCTGNLITIIIIIQRQLYKKVTFLAICLLTFPDTAAVFLRGETVYIKDFPSNKLLKEILYSATFVTACASNGHIIILARLRYKLVAYPLFNLTYKPRHILKQSFLVWTISIIIGVPYFYIPELVTIHETQSLIEIIISVIIFLSVCLPVLTFHCLKIRHLKKGLTSQQDIASRMSMVVTIILFFHVVTMCSIPVGVVCSKLGIGGVALHPTVQFMLMLNHSINPVIYFLSNCCKNRRNSVSTPLVHDSEHNRQTSSV